MIEVEGLSKTYRKQCVLNNVSLTLERGRCIALIGPNGSGKTTLIKAILGLIFPDKGRIKVNGKPVDHSPEYRKDIGYMSQLNRMPEHMRIGQLFGMLRSLRNDISPDTLDRDLYAAFGMEQMKDKPLGALSGGMRQKVNAALAFLFNPNILILDEPTAALDPMATETLKQKIWKAREEQKLILVTSHILHDLDGLADEVIYMFEGRILFRKLLNDLEAETRETRLSRMIVAKLEKEGHTWEN